MVEDGGECATGGEMLEGCLFVCATDEDNGSILRVAVLKCYVFDAFYALCLQTKLTCEIQLRFQHCFLAYFGLTKCLLKSINMT